ncbi:hypothetical protein EUX98_g11 [Antrodiella citrinella]|uniref:Protein kinase domain-containing protein n=1 Tax=Antrodiella citrinella TaxID=2447956 RepID=A0A4S4NDM6_9APHY|nr:hypothetical protein EUX98_g11 [Antrodiella citrinella]
MSDFAEPSSSTGPSTPSRKRSRWEVDDDRAPTPKESHTPKRGRSKAKSQAPISELSASAPPSPPRTNIVKWPLHSIYVPPRTQHPPLAPSRSVYCYERLNSIEEGSYGVVFRARDKETGDIVALKKFKLDEEKHGFPITALREINALMVCKHENVVGIREIVVGDTLTQDLKTSNLLMNNRGTIKVADFGLARRYGDPVGVGGLTQLVVTLWYRAPEILLGATTYSTAVDMWSVGCIFAELLLKEPLFQAKGEVELIAMIFKMLGPPTSSTWPDYNKLPLAKTLNLPVPHPHQLRQKFPYITTAGLDLLSQMLTYDPEMRITAEEAMSHPYFSESPLPKHPDLFGSFPSAAAGEKRGKLFDSPSAPTRKADYKLLTEFDIQ